LPSAIEQVHREYGDQGLSVWAVNLGEPRGRVEAWTKEKGLTMPVLLDTQGAVARAYRVTGTPTVVLVGRDGRVVGRAVGMRAWAGEQGRALIRALLAGREGR
jgi:peroxiredoxin